MDRNTETLSTRDLASPNEPAGEVTTSEGNVRDAATPEGQPEVYDQAATAPEGTPPPPMRTRSSPPTSRQCPQARFGGGPRPGIRASRRAGRMPARAQRAAAPAVRTRTRRRSRHKPLLRRIRTPRRRPIRRPRRPPPRTAARCFRPTWTPCSNKVERDPDPVRRRAPRGGRGRR